jgi:hypothetical protein
MIKLIVLIMLLVNGSYYRKGCIRNILIDLSNIYHLKYLKVLTRLVVIINSYKRR